MKIKENSEDAYKRKMTASLLKSRFYCLIESKDEFLKLVLFEWQIDFEKPDLKRVKIHKDKRRTIREREKMVM